MINDENKPVDDSGNAMFGTARARVRAVCDGTDWEFVELEGSAWQLTKKLTEGGFSQHVCEAAVLWANALCCSQEIQDALAADTTFATAAGL